MTRVIAAVVVAAMLGIACGSGDAGDRGRADAGGRTRATPSASPTFDRGRALIDTDGSSLFVDVEIAATQEQRQFGLMFRESLPDQSGMIFLFFKETTGGFWMKNTLIPLSIAFFDDDGRIVELLDMEPCKKDPCRVYDPGVSYFGALEVNQGAFERWDVDEGDRISISPDR